VSLVEAGAHDAANRFQVALDEEGMVIPAVCQPLAARPPNVVLRAGGKRLDPLRVDAQLIGTKGLPTAKSFEIAVSHFHRCPP